MQSYTILPARKYKFTKANPKKFISNYFTIDLSSNKTVIYQYSLEIEPHIESDSTKKIYKIISNAIEAFKQKIGYIASRGNIVYGTKDQNNGVIIESKMIEDNKEVVYNLLLRQNNKLPLKDMLHSHIVNERMAAMQVLNVNTKQRLKQLNMVDVGKGKFYYRVKIIKQMFENGFFVMRGYKYTTCLLNNAGLCLQVDIFSRLIRQANVLQEIFQLTNNGQPLSKLQGAIAIARYGNFRTYQIIKVDYDKSPLTKFTPHNRQHEVTYKQYFKQQYDLDVTMSNQPLILSASKVQKLKNKEQKMQKIYHYIYLIPEFLSLAGLSDSQRNSFNLMRDVADKTKIGSHSRMNKILDNVGKFNETQGLFTVKEPLAVNGFQMLHPTICAGNGNFEPMDGRIKLDKRGVKQRGMFKNWFLFYHRQHEQQAHLLKKSMLYAANSLGIDVREPEHINEDKLKAEDWVNAIQEELEYSKSKNLPIPSIMLILVGGIIKDEIYNEVKALCTLKLQIPSQFVHIKKIGNLAKKNNLLSYSTNLLLQMNAKVGKTIWSVPTNNLDFRNKTVMTGGMSISKVGTKKSLGFVGTINKELTKIYNETKVGISNSQIGVLLQGIFANWLRAFYLFNNKNLLPDVIVFYREGISRTQISKNSQKQIEALHKMVQVARAKTKFTKYNPEIIYIVVNKQSNSRFYEGKNLNFINPRPGSVVIDDLTIGNFFDFHLAPHQVDNSITSNPSHFMVCHHEPKRISNEAIIEFTYEQCYNYYNWKGSIKFPACLENADRLAKMTCKTLKTDIKFDNIMSRTFHFL